MTQGLPPVLGTAELAEFLGWDRRKVAVYHGRGLLPAPLAELACGPVWQRDDIERWMSGSVEAAAKDSWLWIRHFSVDEMQAQHAMLNVRRVSASAEGERLAADAAKRLLERLRGAREQFPGRRYRMVVALVPEGRWTDAKDHTGGGEPRLRAKGSTA